MSAAFIETAIERHLAWIASFQAALAGTRTEPFDATLAMDDAACALGRWFASDEAWTSLGVDLHGRAMALHAAFHEIAGEVVESLAASDPPEVTNSLIGALVDLSRSLIEFLRFADRHLPGASPPAPA